MKRAFAVLLMIAMSVVCFTVPEADAQEVLRLYGMPTATSVLMRLVNDTGETITEMRLLPAGEEMTEETPELLGEDDFPVEARIGLWVELQPEWLGEEDTALYDILLTFGENEIWTLHNVPATDIGEATIYRDSHVVWLCYISLSTGQEVCTWLDEMKILAETEAFDFPLTDGQEREDSGWDPDRSS